MNPTSGLKIRLLAACIAVQEAKVEDARAAMLDAQATANEQPNKMGDKHESFREQMQIGRDLFAQRYDEGLQMLITLRKINAENACNKAVAGALVETDKTTFFIAASLGQVPLENQTYLVVSVQSPIFKAMAGLQKGERFEFRDQGYLIKDIL